jgi:NTP pyrophosphatase (non-canonical NTP hydrolase)
VREEFMELMKAFYQYYYVDKSESNRKELQKEIGDLFIALLNFCEILGFDIEVCAKMSHDKNKERDYRMIGGECVRDK